jgi:hypothetical protein
VRVRNYVAKNFIAWKYNKNLRMIVTSLTCKKLKTNFTYLLCEKKSVIFFCSAQFSGDTLAPVLQLIHRKGFYPSALLMGFFQ